MIQISKCMPQGAGLAPVLIKRAATEAFELEGGAYAHGTHGHEHAAAPARRVAIPVVAAAPHVHGPGCSHEHS